MTVGYNSAIGRQDIATASDYIQLLKPRVMALVVFTAVVGYFLAPGIHHPFLGLVSILCIAVGAGASGAINMWYDHDIDLVMKRTRSRPIPSGKISPENALAFGIILAAGSIITLAFAANYLAAMLLALTIGFYVFIYTMWLKRRTPQNIVIGGAAGAFPPMIGWVVAANTVSIESIVLFMIIFLWTPPHFWALSLYSTDDYARAKVPMLPVVAGEHATKRQIFIYSIFLVATSIMPYVIGMSGALYLGIVCALGGVFVFLAAQVWQSDDIKSYRMLFWFSILYLFLLYGALVFDKFAGDIL